MFGHTILGIDPGLGTVGFGWVRFEAETGHLMAGAWGAIHTSVGERESTRLLEIHRDLETLIAEVKPSIVAIERVFFAKNITTALSVSQARGVILLAMEAAGLPVVEYTPMQVKLALTGYGKAKKPEVKASVIQTLSLTQSPRPDDAADALAVAICLARHWAELDPKLRQLQPA